MEVYREIFCLFNLSTREKLCVATYVMSFHLGGISPIYLVIGQRKQPCMLQYIEHIVEPYVRSFRELLYTPTTSGVIIMNNFKGQVTDKVTSLLEKCHLHVCLLPTIVTDLLEPIDVSVNKPAKIS